MNLYTKGLNLKMGFNEAEKAMGKRLANMLKNVCDNNKKVYYIQANKHRTPEQDFIGFYRKESHKYILIPLKKLAECAQDLDEATVLKEVKRISTKIASNKVTKAITDLSQVAPEYVIEAKMNIIANDFCKSLERKPLPTVLDFNYWIDFAYAKLRVKAPKTEDELTDRYLKTLKVYAMAYYAGRNLPVPVLRTILRELSYNCPTIHEIKQKDELYDALTTVYEIKKTSKKAEGKVEERLVEVKCQVAYPVNQYLPTTLILGSHNVEKIKNKVNNEVITRPFLGENVAFVTKTSLRETSPNKDGEGCTTKLLRTDQLEFYVPIPEEKKTDSIHDTQGLTEVAYNMAVSLNYPLVRVDFR